DRKGSGRGGAAAVIVAATATVRVNVRMAGSMEAREMRQRYRQKPQRRPLGDHFPPLRVLWFF
ncbi:hypothetical protein, partial [Streptomyces sp. NPDC006333]|uniref:hypothetical protein n=1 Tax=Streptomyces sp. NPDC006333 TaxID=3156753 RepID=UPI0033A94CB2